MKRIWSLMVAAFLIQGLSAETRCNFQLSTNSLNIHEGLGIIGEVTGTGFDSDTKVQIDCNAANAEPFIGLPTTATTSAFSPSYYPFKARCGYLAVGQDTIYEVSATLLPENIPCTPTGSNLVTIHASGTPAKASTLATRPASATSAAPASAGIEPTDNAISSGGRYGNIAAPETVQSTPTAPVSACGGLDQIPCEKKTNSNYWMFPFIYVCNAPYANNGAYPKEKARCVACRAGTKYDDGRCVIDNGNKTTPSPTSKPAGTPIPTVVATPASPPSPTPVPIGNPPQAENGGAGAQAVSQTISQTQKPINENEDHYVYRLYKGWNAIGFPWEYGGESFDCRTDDVNQIRFYSYSKSRKIWDSITSHNTNNLRGTGLAVYSPVNCQYSIARPQLTQDQSISLRGGWNFISVHSGAFSGPGFGLNIKNDCTITGGPWRYDNENKKYVRDSFLRPGYAYWIEVKNPICDIQVLGENQPPGFP